MDYVNVGQSNSKTVTNILKRAAIREVIKDNLAIYTKYIIKSGETPESIAFNVYGDAELHWVILLTNDIYDRYHQWHMNVINSYRMSMKNIQTQMQRIIMKYHRALVIRR